VEASRRLLDAPTEQELAQVRAISFYQNGVWNDLVDDPARDKVALFLAVDSGDVVKTWVFVVVLVAVGGLGGLLGVIGYCITTQKNAAYGVKAAAVGAKDANPANTEVKIAAAKTVITISQAYNHNQSFNRAAAVIAYKRTGEGVDYFA
jgi:hypothetical protein